MSSVQTKFPNAGTTIFTVMSMLANQHKAINLGQGFPDFSMDTRLIDLVTKAMHDGYNQYVHMNGLPLLRERIAEKIQELYQADVSASDEITITPGGTYAIYTALTSIVHKGDEVIVLEPAYDSYIPNILINGGKPVLIPLNDGDFSINWEKLRKSINTATKAIIINSPHNPSGALIRESDIEELRQIVKEHDLFIISDEVYEHLIFDDAKHLSLLRYPELRERTFCCYSFGKVYHCTGWKIGYCVAPQFLMKEFRSVHQFNCFTTNSPVQYALSEFLRNKQAYLDLGKQLQKKRDLLKLEMEGTGFKPIYSGGSYFQLYSYEGLSEKPELEFAKQLTVEAGVATIPVSPFYQEGKNQKLLRFCFAKKESTLQEAASRLRNYFK